VKCAVTFTISPDVCLLVTPPPSPRNFPAFWTKHEENVSKRISRSLENGAELKKKETLKENVVK
jgi:hypothetical protein